MYGKLFSSMYDGTLVESWEALVTFQQMLILCDADGVIDMTANAIAMRTGLPLEIVAKGIAILEECDPQSRTPDEEGRRIKRLDEHREWGWYIVNHAKYRSFQDSDTVREQNRIRKQRQREREEEGHVRSRAVTCGHGPSRHTDTDTDINNPANAIAMRFARFWEAYPRKKDKKNAKKAFRKLNPDDGQLDRMLAALATQAAGWKDPQFAPYPSTWLNGERWEDEDDPEPEVREVHYDRLN